MQGYNFTERVRKVLAMAREEASRLHHEYVGTEHILLGLIREGGGVAAAVLQNLEVDLDEIQEKIEEQVKKGRREQTTGPDLPYTSASPVYSSGRLHRRLLAQGAIRAGRRCDLVPADAPTSTVPKLRDGTVTGIRRPSRLRERPFLMLAFFTLIVGAVWHLSGLDYDQGPLGFALFAVSYVLGMPFIMAMRLVGSVVTHPGVRGILGLVLGLLPYLAADEALRRHRLRKRERQRFTGE